MKQLNDVVVNEYHRCLDAVLYAYHQLAGTEVSLLSVILLVVLLWLVLVFSPRSKDEGQMDQKERNAKLIVQYGLGDALFEMLHKELISKKEYEYWCKRLGYDLGMACLLRENGRGKRGKGLTAYLKAESAHRLALMQKIKPNIPGPKPGEQSTTEDEHTTKLRKFFAI